MAIMAGLFFTTLSINGCSEPTPAMKAAKIEPSVSSQKSDGPNNPKDLFRHAKGDATAGREVYRFETFGTEGFWTDAMRLPQGVLAAKFTPIQALKAGLQVDIDAIDPAMREAMAAELKTDLSRKTPPCSMM